MNGGQLTPTSQHSVPSPADVDGEHPASTGSSSSTHKSGHSSPAHVPAHLVPTGETHAVVANYSNAQQNEKPIENFVAAMHHVLQHGAPQCSLADAAQIIQLNELTTCLHSLLDLHRKVILSCYILLFK